MVRRAWWFKALVGCVAVGACGDDVPGPGGDPPTRRKLSHWATSRHLASPHRSR